jgi:serine/threonine kinase 32
LGFNGIGEIKNHPWLTGLNWEKLKSKDIESPFIPMMKKSNFDQDEQITIEDEE